MKVKECVERGECDEAIDHFTQAIAAGGFDSSNLASLYNNRGIAYSLRKDYDKALDDFTMAVKVDHLSALPVYNMARLYSLTEKTGESCTWLRKAIEMGYDDWKRIKADTTLDNIRDSSRYKVVMAGTVIDDHLRKQFEAFIGGNVGCLEKNGRFNIDVVDTFWPT